MDKAPITAIVITKNEERAIRRCLEALSFCNQILVIDSKSTDHTVDIATQMGAEVIQFEWDGEYPKKKQWGMQHPAVRNTWVLHVDGDEVVPPSLAHEIARTLRNGTECVAFDLPIEYYFMGRRLRFGHRVVKRSLVRRDSAKFPEVGDLKAPGITEVEGHYQPLIQGPIGALRSRLVHDDPDPLRDWIARHNRYSDWEAYLMTDTTTKNHVRTSRGRGGKLFDRVPFKPLFFFLYSFVIRLGFLDGRTGFDYAFALSWYYWSIGAKCRDQQREST